MFTWKDFYVELERRREQVAEAEHYRLVKLCSYERETSFRNWQVRFSPMHYVVAKKTK